MPFSVKPTVCSCVYLNSCQYIFITPALVPYLWGPVGLKPALMKCISYTLFEMLWFIFNIALFKQIYIQHYVIYIHYRVICIQYHVICIQYHAICVQYHVICVQYHVIYIQYHVIYIQYHVIYIQYHVFSTGRWFSPVSSTNKTDRHDITEILLKVSSNKHHQTNKQYSTSRYLYSISRHLFSISRYKHI